MTGTEWDATLFTGAAAHYVRGRIPYPPGLVDALRTELDLDGRGVLLDVGAGPGVLTVLLAPAFARVVAVEPDPGMAAYGRRAVQEHGLAGVEWRITTAERMDLPAASVDVAVFGRSFHWMDRPRVAALLRDVLRPGTDREFSSSGGGHLVLARTVPRPPPPWQEPLRALRASFLGAQRRAGRRTLPDGTPSDEEEVLAAAGYTGPTRLTVPGGPPLTLDAATVVADLLSRSSSTPHLLGARLAEFEARATEIVAPHTPYTVAAPAAQVRIWSPPGRR